MNLGDVLPPMQSDDRQNGFCVWMTGLPSAGKTTIAYELQPQLIERGRPVEVLDGDEARMLLSTDLGYDRDSREIHAARVTFVAKLLARNGVIPVVSLISPYRTSRSWARSQIGPFVEVYVNTPLEECERRDVKGLYGRSRAGALRMMTGIDDPYEPPERPEIVVETVGLTPRESAGYVVRELERLGHLPPSENHRATRRETEPASVRGR
jgi:adenylylsulfate kinase